MDATDPDYTNPDDNDADNDHDTNGANDKAEKSC